MSDEDVAEALMLRSSLASLAETIKGVVGGELANLVAAVNEGSKEEVLAYLEHLKDALICVANNCGEAANGSLRPTSNEQPSS